MIDMKRLLDKVLGHAGTVLGSADEPDKVSAAKKGKLRDVNLGSFGGGAMASGLAGLLLGSKSGRKLGKFTFKLGGLALIAALAYRAYQKWRSGAFSVSPKGDPEDVRALPAPTETPFLPSRDEEQQRIAHNLLRAMIGAAKADGHVDATEQARIFAKMDELDLGTEDKAFVMDELRAPVDLPAIARSAHTPEEAAEIYTASLLAIEGAKAEERDHLSRLAALLGLEDRLVRELEASVRSAVILEA